MTSDFVGFTPISWLDGKVALIDQNRLPTEEIWLEFGDYREVVSAIAEMRIRGAPAIGVAGAYALALAAREISVSSPSTFQTDLDVAGRIIERARPTAINLHWAIDRMLTVGLADQNPNTIVQRLIDEAITIHREDEQANWEIGRLGAQLLPQKGTILTHCNTGALATGGYGTALGVIRTAWMEGKVTRVFATETRPFFQGSRLTAWELAKAQIETTLVTDSAAGELMRRGQVQVVIVGADRIVANGDVANKIGTYALAVLAHENAIPFYVAAPTSTIDTALSCGDEIPIEERASSEITHLKGIRLAPVGVDALNLAFDITPHRYIRAIITEKGVVQKPYSDTLHRVLKAAHV